MLPGDAADDSNQVVDLGRGAVEGHRHTPQGVELQWLQIGVKNVIDHGNLPFFVKWVSDPEVHPSHLTESSTRLSGLTIGGEPTVVRAWL